VGERVRNFRKRIFPALTGPATARRSGFCRKPAARFRSPSPATWPQPPSYPT